MSSDEPKDLFTEMAEPLPDGLPPKRCRSCSGSVMRHGEEEEAIAHSLPVCKPFIDELQMAGTKHQSLDELEEAVAHPYDWYPPRDCPKCSGQLLVHESRTQIAHTIPMCEWYQELVKVDEIRESGKFTLDPVTGKPEASQQKPELLN